MSSSSSASVNRCLSKSRDSSSAPISSKRPLALRHVVHVGFCRNSSFIFGNAFFPGHVLVLCSLLFVGRTSVRPAFVFAEAQPAGGGRPWKDIVSYYRGTFGSTSRAQRSIPPAKDFAFSMP